MSGGNDDGDFTSLAAPSMTGDKIIRPFFGGDVGMIWDDGIGLLWKK